MAGGYTFEHGGPAEIRWWPPTSLGGRDGDVPKVQGGDGARRAAWHGEMGAGLLIVHDRCTVSSHMLQ
jgi:hypothetical protein